MTHPVDTILPPRQLLALGLQHLLVMAASPITAAFVISRALNLAPDVTVNLISATFLVCGLWEHAASLRTVRNRRAAAIRHGAGRRAGVHFLSIAKLTDIQTAVGAVLMTAVFYVALLPVFARCLRFFPDLVIGTMLLLVGVNLIAVYGAVISRRPRPARRPSAIPPRSAWPWPPSS